LVSAVVNINRRRHHAVNRDLIQPGSMLRDCLYAGKPADNFIWSVLEILGISWWYTPLLLSMLWHCRMGVRKTIRPVKTEWRGVGVVITPVSCSYVQYAACLYIKMMCLSFRLFGLATSAADHTPLTLVCLPIASRTDDVGIRRPRRLSPSWLSVWDRGADCLHMVQLMPLHPKTPSSLASFKSILVYLFLVLAYPGCPW